MTLSTWSHNSIFHFSASSGHLLGILGAPTDFQTTALVVLVSFLEPACVLWQTDPATGGWHRDGLVDGMGWDPA